MKKTSILKQSFELSNDFNMDVTIEGLRKQLESKIFTELIKGEKHSLTLAVEIFVNEEEREDKDPRLVELVDCIQSFKNLLKTYNEKGIDLVKMGLENGDLDLFMAWKKSAEIVTSKY